MITGDAGMVVPPFLPDLVLCCLLDPALHQLLLSLHLPQIPCKMCTWRGRKVQGGGGSCEAYPVALQPRERFSAPSEPPWPTYEACPSLWLPNPMPTCCWATPGWLYTRRSPPCTPQAGGRGAQRVWEQPGALFGPGAH